MDKNNGQISDIDNFILSDYIEVKSENEYYKRFYGDVVFFDSSKTFMSGMSATGKMNFTTPKDCKYIRVNIAGIDNLQQEIVAPSTADHTFAMPTGTQFIKNDFVSNLYTVFVAGKICVKVAVIAASRLVING